MKKILGLVLLLCFAYPAFAESPFVTASRFNEKEMQLSADTLNNVYRGILPAQKIISDGFGGSLMFHNDKVYAFTDTDYAMAAQEYDEAESEYIKSWVINKAIQIAALLFAIGLVIDIASNIQFGKRLRSSLSLPSYMKEILFKAVAIIICFAAMFITESRWRNTEEPINVLLSKIPTEKIDIYERTEIPELMKYYDKRYKEIFSNNEC